MKDEGDKHRGRVHPLIHVLLVVVMIDSQLVGPAKPLRY